MKIKRSELNTLIENYLFEHALDEARRQGITADIYIAKCNFEFQPEFLEVIEFIKGGGAVPGHRNPDSTKPDFFNPLFLDAFKNQALPFMNMFVAPQFGIQTKCDTLMELQTIFNNMYQKFSSGFKYQTPTDELTLEEKEKRAAEIEAKIPGVHKEYFDKFLLLMRKNNIKYPPPERLSRLVDNPPTGLTNPEMIYATMILGNLDKAKTENKRHVRKIIDNFENPGSISSFKDIIKLCSPSKDIPGYEEARLRGMFMASSVLFKRDPAAGAQDMVLVTKLVFDKLKSAGVV